MAAPSTLCCLWLPHPSLDVRLILTVYTLAYVLRCFTTRRRGIETSFFCLGRGQASELTEGTNKGKQGVSTGNCSTVTRRELTAFWR